MTKYSVRAPDGNTYSIEGPEGASDEDVISEIMRQNPQAVGGKAAAPEAPATAAALAPAPVKDQTSIVNGIGAKDQFRLDPTAQAEVDAAVADPNRSWEDVNALVNQHLVAGGQAPLGLGGSPADLAKYRQAVAKTGKPVSVGYQDFTSTIPAAQPSVSKIDEVNPKANPLVQFSDSVGRGFEGLVRSYQEGVQYGFPGLAARTYADWTDQGKAELRKKYPDATDDQIEQMADAVIAQTQKSLRAANANVTENDPVVPYLAGQLISSLGPEDLVPGVGEVSGIAKRTAKAAGVNAAVDAGYQGLDVHQGVQDEYNPEQSVVAAGLGGGLHLGLEGISLASTKVRPEGTPSGRVGVPNSADAAARFDERTKSYIGDKKATPAVRRKAAAQAVADHINDVTEGWKNAPEFEVHESFDKLPGVDSDALGMIDDNGKVVVNLKAITAEAKDRGVSPTNIVTAMTYHEGLGHHGMTQLFGDGLDTILERMYNEGPAFKKKVDNWLKANPDEYKDHPNRIARAADEVLAEMSEAGQLPSSMINKFKNFVKGTARKMGMKWDYTNREIETILGMAHSATVRGITPSENGFVGRRYMSPNREKAFMEYVNAQNVRPSQLFKELEEGRNPEAEHTIKAREAQLAGRPAPEPMDKTKISRAYDDSKSVELYTRSEAEPGKLHTSLMWPNRQDIVDFRYVDPETGSEVYGAFHRKGDTASEFEIYGEGRNAVGPKTVQTIRRQLREQFPEIKKIDATRISGARNKGAEVPLKDGKHIEVRLGRYMKRLDDQAGLANDNNRYQKVYHGSRHNFDKFDIDKVGEGEGAQVYGHGLYFAENKAVASHYKQAGSYYDGSHLHREDDEHFIQGKKVTQWVKENMPTTSVRVAPLTENGKPVGRKWATRTGKPLFEKRPLFTEDEIKEIIATANHPHAETDIYQLYNVYADIVGTTERSWARAKIDLEHSGSPKKHKEALAKLKELYHRQSEDLRKQQFISDIAVGLERKRGNLYEVNLKEKGNWLHWDKPWDEQGEGALKRLRAAGLVDTSATEKEASRLRAEHAQVQDRLDQIDTQIDHLQSELHRSKHERLTKKMEKEDGTIDADIIDLENQRSDLENDLDDLRVEMRGRHLTEFEKRTGVEDKDIGPIKPTGRDIYNAAVQKYGSPREASAALNSHGIIGIKYLDGMSRREGEGSHNYVVFDHDNAEITKRYMKRKSKDLSSDDVFESENALANLRAITEDYVPVTMSIDDLRREAEARGLSPDRLLKNKELDLGELPRRFIMQDIAAEKLNEKVTALNNKIQNGGGTYKDRVAHTQALLKFKELSARIFDEQGEAGRMLRIIQELQYTKKKVTGVRDALEGLSEENLQEILNDPEAYARFAKGIQDQVEESKAATKKGKFGEALANVLNIPRALMSSVDLSAPFRQGLFLVGRPEFWKSLPSMMKYLTSKGAYENLMADITSRNSYPAMVEGGLAFSGTSGKLSSREEAFQSELAHKIPILGKLVEVTERAYSGFLNKLRADTFDGMMAEADKAGYEEVGSKKFVHDLANFVNHATGRGNLGGVLNSAAPLLNSLFFSPRLIASRAQLLNPQYYMKLDPFVRKQAIKSLLSATGFVTGVLTMAAMAGAEVETDPRSSDFGKIKVGDTRYDIPGGFAQYITLGARVIPALAGALTGHEEWTGAEKTALGDIKPYGHKFGQKTALDAAGKFLTNKAAPIPSFILDAFRGTDAVGQPFNMKTAVASRFIPMFAQDFADVTNEYGMKKGAMMAAPGVLGVGIQTYKPKSADPDAEVEAPDSFQMQELEDGENEMISVKDGTVTLKGEAQKEWQRRLTFYMKEWVKDEIADPAWKKKSLKEQAEVIKDVRNDAKKQAKEDMLPLLGLDDGTPSEEEDN